MQKLIRSDERAKTIDKVVGMIEKMKYVPIQALGMDEILTKVAPAIKQMRKELIEAIQSLKEDK